jgi:hypothetical protein
MQFEWRIRQENPDRGTGPSDDDRIALSRGHDLILQVQRSGDALEDLKSLEKSKRGLVLDSLSLVT